MKLNIQEYINIKILKCRIRNITTLKAGLNAKIFNKSLDDGSDKRISLSAISRFFCIYLISSNSEYFIILRNTNMKNGGL